MCDRLATRRSRTVKAGAWRRRSRSAVLPFLSSASPPGGLRDAMVVHAVERGAGRVLAADHGRRDFHVKRFARTLVPSLWLALTTAAEVEHAARAAGSPEPSPWCLAPGVE